jgi:hypothetical protein
VGAAERPGAAGDCAGKGRCAKLTAAEASSMNTTSGDLNTEVQL